MSTPYDGKIGLWHFKGEALGESSIQELADTIKNWAPASDAIWVKTSDGDTWEGEFDSGEMAVNGVSDIARWVDVLADNGLEFHAWANVTGENVAGEIDRVVEAANVPGVRSMILDVEPYEGHWQGTQEDVTALMSGIRNRLGTDFHIGISVDPRQQHYASIFPGRWRPYVDSVHPQVYWVSMGRDPQDLLDETYVVWGAYEKPIYPVLQGTADPNSLRRAQNLARSVRGATGLSYWRLGVIGPLQFPVIQAEKVEEEVGPDDILRRYGWEKIVAPYEAGYHDGTQTGQPSSSVFREFTSVRGHKTKYKATGKTRDTVWAAWRPSIPEDGIYEVSVYIPSRHATTRNAEYHIHGIKGRGTELLVKLRQERYSNQWVPLVVYEFEQGAEGAQVNLTDLTGEDGLEIAFGAVRWRQVVEQTEPPVGAGFDPPVGTAEERLSSEVWPNDWYDATGYATYYTTVGAAYHTGADLNLPHDADKDTPVYAPADGRVTYSARNLGSWAWLIVIRHDPLADGTVVWSRCAHVANPIVSEGDIVERGQQICSIGNADGQLAFHLHFDIAVTDVLERNPGHWPGNNLDGVLQNYVDPRAFILAHRPPGR
jgi:murein DD-endopeptidase MepM/ murein hydrolase activator NlpD